MPPALIPLEGQKLAFLEESRNTSESLLEGNCDLWVMCGVILTTTTWDQVLRTSALQTAAEKLNFGEFLQTKYTFWDHWALGMCFTLQCDGIKSGHARQREALLLRVNTDLVQRQEPTWSANTKRNEIKEGFSFQDSFHCQSWVLMLIDCHSNWCTISCVPGCVVMAGELEQKVNFQTSSVQGARTLSGLTTTTGIRCCRCLSQTSFPSFPKDLTQICYQLPV